MANKFNLSSSSQCIKYLMFVFNLIFVISGIILLSVGCVVSGVYYNYQHFLDDKFFSVPALLTAIGSIIFFIAFFGCCGAIKENYCMIVTFAALMVLIFILELSAGIAGYVLRNDVKDTLENKMIKTMGQYNESIEIRDVWNLIQTDLHCCGAYDRIDWIKALNTTDGSLPMSCCERLSSAIGSETCRLTDTDRVYNATCLNTIETFVKARAIQLGGAGLGIAFIQAIGIWFSIYLARSFKQSYNNM